MNILVPTWRVPLSAAVGVDMSYKMMRKLAKVCVIVMYLREYK